MSVAAAAALRLSSGAHATAVAPPPGALFSVVIALCITLPLHLARAYCAGIPTLAESARGAGIQRRMSGKEPPLLRHRVLESIKYSTASFDIAVGGDVGIFDRCVQVRIFELIAPTTAMERSHRLFMTSPALT
ncbi:hypothetical protein DFH09DRAFT_1319129 [Mycena vulgaris]|nr:hypothetical protein DFH09DRAFT_1319129 [Mycena vulgaris]